MRRWSVGVAALSSILAAVAYLTLRSSSEDRDFQEQLQALQEASARQPAGGGTAAPEAPRRPKAVYVVFPSSVEPSKNPERVKAIRETWGAEAHHIYYIGYDEFAVPDGLARKNPGGTEFLKWAFDRAAALHPDFDYLVKADDITYVIPRNMDRFLAGRNVSRVEMLGRRLVTGGGDMFCSGGAGYALSRAAFSYLATHFTPGDIEREGGTAPCIGATKWLKDDAGDVSFAKCLPDGSLVDTRADAAAAGGERFHAYGPQRTAAANVDDWFKKYTPWYTPPAGVACCARDTITFHYVEAAEARALHRLFRDRSAFAALSDEERRAAWPDRAALGSYARRPEEGDAMWELLLSHIRIAGA